jgi:hypothetical protein
MALADCVGGGELCWLHSLLCTCRVRVPVEVPAQGVASLRRGMQGLHDMQLALAGAQEAQALRLYQLQMLRAVEDAGRLKASVRQFVCTPRPLRQLSGRAYSTCITTSSSGLGLCFSGRCFKHTSRWTEHLSSLVSSSKLTA